MSALTQNERDGLDDVFLSIHSNEDKLQRIKEISRLIISHGHKLSMQNMFKQAKYGIKESGFSHFIPFISKKKKNLSK